MSADFTRPISPCQFGGNPDCSNCGCIASAGLGAIARHRLPGGLRVGAIFENSLRQSLTLSHGSSGIFLSRPVSAVLLAVTALVLTYPLWSRLFRARPA